MTEQGGEIVPSQEDVAAVAARYPQLAAIAGRGDPGATAELNRLAQAQARRRVTKAAKAPRKGT
jgi:hypothetical protein